jgi:hypothetical protein
MTSSRSIDSTSDLASRAASRVRPVAALLVALVALVGFARIAEAKKHIAVLAFSGPKASQFQGQVTGVVKKAATLVSASKWADTADDLHATKPTAKNIAKVASKLGADGVVVGSVERRGSRYFVHVKLRAGQSGDVVAQVDLVVRSGKLSGSDLGEVKEQIVGAFDALPTPGDDGGDDSGDEPVARGKGKGKGKDKGKHVADASDDDGGDSADTGDDEPAARDKDKDKDDDKHRAFRGRDKDDDARGKDKDKDDDRGRDDDTRGKDKDKDDDGDRDRDRDRVASRGDASSDDDDAIGAAGEPAGDPRHRPLDALAGMSFTGRRLTFTTTPGLTNKPQGYKTGTLPVPGVFIDAQLYPLAFNPKSRSLLRDFGVTVLFDRVLSISSQLGYKDAAGVNQVATLGTTEQRYGVGLIFRHALGHGATDPTLYASVRYNKSQFTVAKSDAPMGVTVDIPNTDYTYLDPGLGIRFPLSARFALDAGARFLVITDTGEMQQPDQYGAATVLGFDADAGADLLLTKQWFVHAGVHLSTIGFTFKGNGDLATKRDGDGSTIDVSAARDTYYAGILTAGYLY